MPKELADIIAAFIRATGDLQDYRASLPQTQPPPPTGLITDRIARPKPAPPALGPAGFRFKDPTFGSSILRVTDEKTNGGKACRVPSNELVSAWNVTSTRFYVVGEGGNAMVYTFDGDKATPVDRLVPGYIEPCFSYADPTLLYVGGGPRGRTILKYNVDTGLTLPVLDLDGTYNVRYPLAGTYLGPMLFADKDVYVVAFGGKGQDGHYLIHHSAVGLLDTAKQPTPFKIHALGLDRTGRFVAIYPRQGDIPKVGQVLIWDTAQNENPPIPLSRLQQGHGCFGYGTYINQCDDGVGPYDGMQWQIRTLPDGAPHRLVPDKLTPPQKYIDDHTIWRNCRPDAQSSVFSSTLRYSPTGDPNLTPPRAWDDEVLSIATDGSRVVRRLAHHQSIWDWDGEFWDQPMIQVDPSGTYVLLNSNWGRTVGANRQDVFLITVPQ